MIKPKHSRRIAVLYIWAMFLLWHLHTRIMLAFASDRTASDEVVNPLYLLTIVITVLFGLSAWLLGRSIKGIDTRLEELEVKDTNLERETKDLCIKIAKLQTRCDDVLRFKGHHEL